MRRRFGLLAIVAALLPAGRATAHQVPPPPEHPYRWISPPPGIDRPPPQGVATSVELMPEGSAPASVATPDL